MHTICNQDPTLRVLIGTELKIAVESGATDLAACDFTADIFTRPDRRVSFTRQDFQPIGGGRLMVVVDTTQLGVGGTVSVALTAHIPDADCPDGFRTEVGECPVMGVSCVAMPGSKPCVCLMAKAMAVAVGNNLGLAIDGYNNELVIGTAPLKLGTGLNGGDNGKTLSLSLGSGLEFTPGENKIRLKAHDDQGVLSLLPDGKLTFSLNRLYDLMESRYNLTKK